MKQTIKLAVLVLMFVSLFPSVVRANHSLQLVIGEFSQYEENVRQRLLFAEKLMAKGLYDVATVLLSEAISLSTREKVELRAAHAYVQGLAGNVANSRFVLSSLSLKYNNSSVMRARAYSYLHCQPTYARAGAIYLRRAAMMEK